MSEERKVIQEKLLEEELILKKKEEALVKERSFPGYDNVARLISKKEDYEVALGRVRLLYELKGRIGGEW